MQEGISTSKLIGDLEYFGYTKEASQVQNLQSLTGRQIRIVSTPPGVAAYVIPGKDSAIFVSLYTALFTDATSQKDIIDHEVRHHEHQASWTMEIPFLNQLNGAHFANIRNTLGCDPLCDMTQLIEGFTEGSVARARGRKNHDVAYTHHEVPMVERLDRLISTKSGGSLLEAFDTMSIESGRDFLRYFKAATNLMMLEKSLYGSISPTRSRGSDPTLGDLYDWYATQFPDDHVIETGTEAGQIVALYHQLDRGVMAA